MKEVVVVSGKGGTGKTSITASLAALLSPLVLADCDVDAADLHLLMQPEVKHQEDFLSGKEPVIDPDACTLCGLCRKHCHYNAISKSIRIDPIACEGCAVCAAICPADAISLRDRHCGEWYRSETRLGPMLHARLGVAQESSGRLVGLIRKQAKEAAERLKSPLILIDGPPGTGCPVISALAGADLAIVVTEPTVSGVHDLGRILDLCAHFNIPAKVILNKANLYVEHEASVIELIREKGAEFLGALPYDPLVTEAMIAGKTVVEFDDGPMKSALIRMADRVRDLIQTEKGVWHAETA